MNKKIIFTLSALLTLGGLSSCNKTTVKSLSVINTNGLKSFQVGSIITDYDFNVSCDLSNGEHKTLSKKDYKLEGNTLPYTFTTKDLKRGYVDFNFKFDDKKQTKRIQVAPIFFMDTINVSGNENFTIPYLPLTKDIKVGLSTESSHFTLDENNVAVHEGIKDDVAYLYAYRLTEKGQKQILDICTINVIDVTSDLEFVQPEGSSYKYVRSNLNTFEDIIIPTYNQGLPIVGFINRDDGTAAFENCKTIKHITLNGFMNQIDTNTFKGCENLESIDLDDNLYYIGNNAFNGCVALQEVTLPDSVYSIESEAFNGCINLEKVSITNNSSLVNIGVDAFKECHEIVLSHNACNYASFYVDGIKEPYFALINVNAAPVELRVHGTTKLISCYNEKNNDIEKLIIPSNVRAISESSFENKNRLKEVKFEDNSKLSYIGSKAFKEAIGLTSIDLPASLRYIGVDAFYSDNTFINSATIGNVYGWKYLETHVVNDFVDIGPKELSNNVNVAQLITRQHLQDPAGYCDFAWFCF